MEVRTLDLPLSGFGAAPRSARVEIACLGAGDRVRRAGGIFLVFLAVAVIGLPIPIVHFGLVPGALLTGTVLAAMRLRQGEIFRAAHGVCPFCEAEQDFAVAGPYSLPKELHCAACHRELTLGR